MSGRVAASHEQKMQLCLFCEDDTMPTPTVNGSIRYAAGYCMAVFPGLASPTPSDVNRLPPTSGRVVV